MSRRGSPTPARPARPTRPERVGRVGRAGVALSTACLLVLGSGLSTAARWSDTVDVQPQQRVESGRLDLQTREDRVEVARTAVGGATTTYSSSAGNLPSTLTLGDIVTVETTAVLRLEGDNLRAEFDVDGSGLARAFGASVPSTLTITPVSGPQLPSPSTSTGTSRTWRVDEAHDGATVSVRVRFTIPPSRDGTAESGAPNANWWRTTLQGTAIGASALELTLEQEPA